MGSSLCNSFYNRPSRCAYVDADCRESRCKINRMKSTAQSQEKPGTLEGLEREQTGDALYGDQLPEGAAGNLESPPEAQ
jgi:hypothetical protein